MSVSGFVALFDKPGSQYAPWVPDDDLDMGTRVDAATLPQSLPSGRDEERPARIDRLTLLLKYCVSKLENGAIESFIRSDIGCGRYSGLIHGIQIVAMYLTNYGRIIGVE